MLSLVVMYLHSVVKGKKSAWQTWNMCSEVTSVFSQLSQYPLTIGDDELQMSEKFVVTMYDRSSMATCVDDANSLLVSGSPMNASLLLELLFYNILIMQHMRLDVYGVKQWCANLKVRICGLGVEKRKFSLESAGVFAKCCQELSKCVLDYTALCTCKCLD